MIDFTESFHTKHDDVILISFNSACMLEYRKLIPCTFKGNLQRNPPENLGKCNRCKQKPPYDTLF